MINSGIISRGMRARIGRNLISVKPSRADMFRAFVFLHSFLKELVWPPKLTLIDPNCWNFSDSLFFSWDPHPKLPLNLPFDKCLLLVLGLIKVCSNYLVQLLLFNVPTPFLLLNMKLICRDAVALTFHANSKLFAFAIASPPRFPGSTCRTLPTLHALILGKILPDFVWSFLQLLTHNYQLKLRQTPES